MIEKEPNRAGLLLGRANAFARLGLWKEAVADFTRALEGKSVKHGGWYQLAPLLLQTGDRVGYRRHRQQALEQRSQLDNPETAAQVCRLALLLPAEGAELEAIGKLAEDIAAPGDSKATYASG